MAGFDDLRAKYKGYSDDEILGALQATKYPDYSITEIREALGWKPQSRNALAVANDTVIEGANAVAGGVKSLADFVAPGNRVSQFIDENIIRPGEASQSDAVKAEKQRLAEETQNADGMLGEAGAALGYVARNPLLAAAQAAGSFVAPGVAIKGAGGLARLAGAGAGAATAAGTAGGVAAGAALSGGDAAGQAYELAIKGGATEEQAQAAARQASLIPAAVGGLTGAFGAEKLFAGGKGFAGGTLSKALKTGLSEAGQEALEEGVTQYEGQRAAMPYDASIDPMKGVAGAATLGAALGGITGAGVSMLHGSPVEAAAPGAPPAEKPLLLGNTPDPYIVFPDGTTGKRADVENYINSLPADQQIAARAKLLNMGAQQALADIATAPDLDTALKAFTQSLALPAPVTKADWEVVDGQQALPAPVQQPGMLSLPAPTGPAPIMVDSQGNAAPMPSAVAAEAVSRATQREQEVTEERAGLQSARQAQADLGLTPDVLAAQYARTEAPAVRQAADQQARVEQAAAAPVDRAERTGSAEGRPVLTTEPVSAFIDSLRQQNTPASRAYVAEFEAGRITPEDVKQRIARETPKTDAQVADERLAAAAKEAPKPGPDDLVTADGFPYGTRSGAVIRAKREGLPTTSVIEVAGGYAVRTKEPTNDQPDVAGTPGQPVPAADGSRADAGGSVGAVGSVPDLRGGAVRAPEAPVASGGQDQAVADGGAADGALTEDIGALRKRWPGLANSSDDHVRAAEQWSRAQDRVRAEYDYRGDRAGEIQDALVEEWGQPRIKANQTAYTVELTRRLNAEADRMAALRNEPGTVPNKRQERRDQEARTQAAGAAQKAIEQDIKHNLERVREMRRQGRINAADEARLLDLAQSSTDSFDAAMKLEGFVADKSVAAGPMPIGDARQPANDAPSLRERAQALKTQPQADTAPPAAAAKERNGQAQEEPQEGVLKQGAAADTKTAAPEQPSLKDRAEALKPTREQIELKKRLAVLTKLKDCMA